jgi:hypothetical protein
MENHLIEGVSELDRSRKCFLPSGYSGIYQNAKSKNYEVYKYNKTINKYVYVGSESDIEKAKQIRNKEIFL